MKVRRYDRQLRNPDLRPLWRYVMVCTMDRAIAKLRGEEPAGAAKLGVWLPWWIARASRGGIQAIDARAEKGPR